MTAKKESTGGDAPPENPEAPEAPKASQKASPKAKKLRRVLFTKNIGIGYRHFRPGEVAEVDDAEYRAIKANDAGRIAKSGE